MSAFAYTRCDCGCRVLLDETDCPWCHGNPQAQALHIEVSA